MIVHNQSEVPFTLNEGINIHPGTKTYISVNREFKNKLGNPYSNCLNDLSNPPNSYAESLFKHFNDLNVTYYDQDFCFKICFQDKLIDACYCSDIITPTIRNTKYCETTEEILCLNNYNYNFSKSDLNDLCDNACPFQCKTINYKLGLSSSVFPTLSYAKALQINDAVFSFHTDVNDSDLIEMAKNGYLKVILNYENLYYTSVDEVPAMTLNDLLGNLGGQLGLFIGISFLSLIELIELIISMCNTVFSHIRSKAIQKNNVEPINTRETLNNDDKNKAFLKSTNFNRGMSKFGKEVKLFSETGKY